MGRPQWHHHELLYHLEHAKGRAEKCLEDDGLDPMMVDEYRACV